MRFSKHKDLISGSFLFAASLAYFVHSFRIRLTNIDRLVGSRLFPQLCGALMMLFGMLLVAGGLKELREERKNAAAAPTDGNAEPGPKPVYRNTVLVLVSFALYIYGMDLIGFNIATLAYLFTQMLILHAGPLRAGRALAYAVLAIAATAAIYYMFNNVFSLLLPKGRLF